MATKTPTKSDNAPNTLADDEPARVDADDGAREDAIRLRAYEISQSADAGTPEENWARAERELGPAS